jgi:hypothetical protein
VHGPLRIHHTRKLAPSGSSSAGSRGWEAPRIGKPGPITRPRLYNIAHPSLARCKLKVAIGGGQFWPAYNLAAFPEAFSPSWQLGAAIARPRSPAATNSFRYLTSSVVKLLGIECYRRPNHGSGLAARKGGEHSSPLSNNWGGPSFLNIVSKLFSNPRSDSLILSELNFLSRSESRVRKSLSMSESVWTSSASE